MIERSPGYALDQAILGTLHQDWTYDFADPYAALENWFRLAGDWRRTWSP